MRPWLDEIVVDEDPPWSEYEKDPLTALIERQNGVVGWWQAIRFLSEKAIRHRVASGRWRRVHRGVYLTHGGEVSARQRQWIAVVAAAPSTQDTVPARLGGISALQVHGLRGIGTDRIHVVVGADRRLIAPKGVVFHRELLPDEDRHPCSHPPTTTVGRAVIDAAAWARSDREAQLVIAASFQQRLVTAAEISPVLDRLPTTRRRRLVVVTMRDAAAGSHSVGELDLVAVCREYRLPLPSRQLRFVDSAGRMRYLDAVFDEFRSAVEVDGAHHDGVTQRWDDIDRETDLLLARYRILRLRVHELREHRAHAAAKIRAFLTVAGWRPTP